MDKQEGKDYNPNRSNLLPVIDLERATGLSKQQVERALMRFERQGLIKIIKPNTDQK